MKPKLIKNGNWKIIFSKNSKCCMLFLEWLELREFAFDFKIKTVTNFHDVDGDFEIKFNQAPENIIEDCYNYLLNNSE
jgi:hypothetical protein